MPTVVRAVSTKRQSTRLSKSYRYSCSHVEALFEDLAFQRSLPAKPNSRRSWELITIKGPR